MANTVGIDSDGWSIIPYASRWTTASKGHDDQYTFYPRDLAYLSSLLKRDTAHHVKLVDGCLERMDKESYADLIISERPDWLVMENSTRTFKDDEWIIRKVKQATGARAMITGQHVSAFPEEGLRFADVVAQGEYLRSVLDFFKNGPDGQKLISPDSSNLIDVKNLPFPEDDDVSRYDYAKKLDLICEYKEIQIYATRGCPYGCVYCVARHAYFGVPDFRVRPVDDVVSEIRYLTDKYPEVEGFFFDDEIHNANIKYSKNLARAIISAGLDKYKYDAMCAYNTFDRESLELMKEAGYYKVRVGIETASDEVAVEMGLKGKHRPAKLTSFLEIAKDVGMKVYGTFTLGGKGASEKEDKKTIGLMAELIESYPLYDCQVSICTPQPGTPFFDWAKSQGLLDTMDWSRFDGGEDAVLSLPGYPADRIRQMRKEALKAYDIARRTRDKKLFNENWSASVLKLGFSPKRVLVFRSSRDWHLDSCFKSILDSWDCELIFVCHEKFAEDYQSRFPRIKLAPVSDPGFLNWDRLDRTTRKELKDFKPDLTLIPSNTLHCRSYGNVERIASESNSKRIMFINACGELRQR